MVPGMTERERRHADLQRLAWLADAVNGPSRTTPRRRRRDAQSGLVDPQPKWTATIALVRRLWRCLHPAPAQAQRPIVVSPADPLG